MALHIVIEMGSDFIEIFQEERIMQSEAENPVKLSQCNVSALASSIMKHRKDMRINYGRRKDRIFE